MQMAPTASCLEKWRCREVVFLSGSPLPTVCYQKPDNLWSEHAAAMIYFPKTQIIALVNQKGGCGKTTSAVAITCTFADLGYSVCLADTDPQCNATESFGVRAESIVEEGEVHAR